MNVDVDCGWIRLQIQEERYLICGLYESAEGIQHSLLEIRMTHIAPIHEEELMRSFPLGSIGTAHKASDPTQCRINLHAQQVVAEAMAEDGRDTLTKRGGRIVVLQVPIVRECELDVRIDKRYALKLLYDIGKFRLVALEEPTPCRHVEEDVLHHEVAARGTSVRLLRQHLATLDVNASA